MSIYKLGGFMQEEIKNVKKLIDENDVISFDVFDTLLLRNILKPTDLFLLLDSYALDNYQINDFSEVRVSAERESRVGHENNETTIEDIYKVISKKYNKDIKKIMERELELEEKFLVANPWMQEIYKYAKKKKKHILAISDMYLPKKFIKKILENNGYQLDEIYVSSENFQVKGNKTLFEYVKKEEKISADKWLHIGDNKISDYESPKEMGINAYHYLSVNKRSAFENKSHTIEESILKGIEQNAIFASAEELTDWEIFGIKCVSPIYYGFTNWIYQLTKHKDNIYFLARDGFAIKQVYEMFKKKLNKKMKTYYLYCSRASFQNPTLVDCSKEFALEILTRYNQSLNQKLQIKNILKSIGLNIEEYKKELKNFDLTSDTILNTENIYRVKKFLSYIYKDITEKLSEKKQIVKKYLIQMDMNKYTDINIVDVGWAGSTQYSLEKFLPQKTFVGYYFGTLKDMYENVKYNSFGYMFDAEEPKERFKMIYENIMMYEFIMSAPHGTTKGFHEHDGKIEPILGDNSINDTSINLFQKSAIRICEKYLKYYDELKNTNPTIYLMNYNTFLKEKNYEDLQMFKNTVESVGYDGNPIMFVPTYKEEYILNNLADFYKEISKSLWNQSFLVEGKNKEEYELLQKKLNKKFTKIKCIIKATNIKSILKALRYPRTTIRKLKSILR